jgi:hypothetical protein
LPDPALANLESWTNIYRSADYIGRHLWRPDEEPAAMQLVDLTATPPLHVSADERGIRKEYCVGSGAHTRYWDGTAPAVALALDELIHANKANDTNKTNPTDKANDTDKTSKANTGA